MKRRAENIDAPADWMRPADAGAAGSALEVSSARRSQGERGAESAKHWTRTGVKWNLPLFNRSIQDRFSYASRDASVASLYKVLGKFLKSSEST